MRNIIMLVTIVAVLIIPVNIAFSQRISFTPTVIKGYNETCVSKDIIEQARQNISSTSKYHMFCRNSQLQRDCKALLDGGCEFSGVYTVKPDDQEPIEVYCDMDTDGGGWTVFQRRQDGSENFFLGWASYVAGFGNPIGEFWLGLEAIHRLTSNRSITTLRVDLRDSQGNPGSATFDTFGVLDASRSYEVNVARYTGGNAGDSLTVHSGTVFITVDNDPTTWCSRIYLAAWWFEAGLYGTCYASSLNGLYTPRTDRPYPSGIFWQTFSNVSLSFSEMKFRRRY